MELFLIPLIKFINGDNSPLNKTSVTDGSYYQLIDRSALSQILLNEGCTKRLLSQINYQNHILSADLYFKNLIFRQDYLRWIFSKYSKSAASQEQIWRNERVILLEWARQFNKSHSRLKILSIQPKINRSSFQAQLTLIGFVHDKSVTNQFSFDFSEALKSEYQNYDLDQAFYMFEISEGSRLASVMERIFNTIVPEARFKFVSARPSNQLVASLKIKEPKQNSKAVKPVESASDSVSSTSLTSSFISSNSDNSNSSRNDHSESHLNYVSSVQNHLAKIASAQMASHIRSVSVKANSEANHVKPSLSSVHSRPTVSRQSSITSVSKGPVLSSQSNLSSESHSTLRSNTSKSASLEIDHPVKSATSVSIHPMSRLDRDHLASNQFSESQHSSSVRSNYSSLTSNSEWASKFDLQTKRLSSIIDKNRNLLKKLSSNHSNNIDQLFVKAMKKDHESKYKSKQPIYFVSSGLALLNSHVQSLSTSLRDNINVISHLSTQYMNGMHDKPNHNRHRNWFSKHLFKS